MPKLGGGGRDGGWGVWVPVGVGPARISARSPALGDVGLIWWLLISSFGFFLRWAWSGWRGRGGWRIVPLTAVIRMPSGIVGKEGGTQDTLDIASHLNLRTIKDVLRKGVPCGKKEFAVLVFFCEPASDVL